MKSLDLKIPDGWAAPERGVHGDGLGVFGASLGGGQHRFWFVPREASSQEALFDAVSGILLREIHPAALVRALYMYPPGEVNDARPDQEGFMLLLGLQPNARFSDDDDLDDLLLPEYSRLTRLVVAKLADLSIDHHPPASD